MSAPKVIELAIAGDTVALRLCMERICPPRRDRPIKLKMASLVNQHLSITTWLKVLRRVSNYL